MDNRNKSKPTTGHEDLTVVDELAEVISPDHLSEDDNHRLVVVNEQTIDEYDLCALTGESREGLLWQARHAEEKGEVVTVLLFDYNKNLDELDQLYVGTGEAGDEGVLPGDEIKEETDGQ